MMAMNDTAKHPTNDLAVNAARLSWALQMGGCLCIAKYDPRLKGN
jgi:hypothetical protein